MKMARRSSEQDTPHERLSLFVWCKIRLFTVLFEWVGNQMLNTVLSGIIGARPAETGETLYIYGSGPKN